MTLRTIHTLAARGNILLESVKDRSGASDSAMRGLIWRAAEDAGDYRDIPGLDLIDA
jgi:hypothetical protein